MPAAAVKKQVGVVMGAPGKGHTELAAVPSRPAAHPRQAFTFHGVQHPISTLGRKWIRAGTAQSHWGTARAAAAKSALKAVKGGGGGKEAHLGSLRKGSRVCPLWLSHPWQPQGTIQDFKFNTEHSLPSP